MVHQALEVIRSVYQEVSSGSPFGGPGGIVPGQFMGAQPPGLWNICTNSRPNGTRQDLEALWDQLDLEAQEDQVVLSDPFGGPMGPSGFGDPFGGPMMGPGGFGDPFGGPMMGPGGFGDPFGGPMMGPGGFGDPFGGPAMGPGGLVIPLEVRWDLVVITIMKAQ